MKTHTPGPWKVVDGWDKNGNGKYFPSVVMSEGKLFGYKHQPKIIVNESHDQEIESLMANAHLIAAAPELLEALNFIVEQMSNPANASHTLEAYTYGVGFDMAKKAIAKAQGES